MKHFKVDLSKFKKVSEDKDSTIMRHADGHEIKVAHKALPKEVRAQFHKLPKIDESVSNNPKLEESKKVPSKFAEGGSTEEDQQQKQQEVQQSNSNIKPAQPTPIDPEKFKKFQQGYQAATKQFADGGDVNSESAQDSPEQIVNDIQATNPQQPQQAPAPAKPMASDQSNAQSADQSSQGLQFPDISQPVMQGVEQQKSGISAEAKAAAQQGAAEDIAYKNNLAQQQDLQNHFKTQSDQLMKERQDLLQSVKDGQIDPHHFVDNMSTLGKISTGIGVLLGGIGAGLNGGPNQALAYLNSQIDRDIDAQKANLGKKQSLLAANLETYKNLEDATNMTKLMMQDQLASQLGDAAAQAKSPQAKAIAQKTIGELQLQQAPVFQQLAMRKALIAQQSANAPGVQSNISNIDPAQFVAYTVPKDQQKEVLKEVGEAQKMVKAKNNILGAFDQIAQINTPSNRIESPIQSTKQIAAIKDPIVAGLSKETAGRFTEQDAKFLDSL